MSMISDHKFDFNENLFLLKSLKCFKLIDLGVSLLDHEDNQQQKLKMEINQDNNFSNKDISPENFNTITSFNDKVIIIKNNEFEDEFDKNSIDSKNIFEKIIQAYRQVFDNKSSNFNLVYKNFYDILYALINNYDNCEYSKFFIKVSTDSIQFKSEAELRRDQSWCHVASLFLKNYETKKANVSTLDDNLLEILDVDMNINDQKNEPSKNLNLQNDLVNKDMNNKGFFTTPTSPSWINNFLSNDNTNLQRSNDNMFLPTDMKKDDSKRNSLASSNSRGNSHNPPPPSIAGSSGFDFSNPNTLMGSRAINEIQSSLMNLQHINTLNFNDNDMINDRNNDDFAIDSSHQVSDNEELNQSYMKPENFNNTLNTQNNNFINNESNKKPSKKINSRRFTSSASSSALNKDKNDIKNSIYQQQLENLKKISNRSATIFKGKLANQNTNNALDSLLKNTKNNLNKHQNSDFGVYDADIEKQIQEQIMSNAALNSLYEDNTNLDRFADLLTNPDEAYQNAQLKNTINGRAPRRHYGNRMTDISFERLHNSPVQFKQGFGSDDIHTIPENSVPEAMQGEFKNINKAFSAPMSKNNSGNKFNFVTKKQLKQNQQRRKLQKAEQENNAVYYGVPNDLNTSLDAAKNAILNNNNYASVMGYLNHLNNNTRMVNGMDFNKRSNIDYELSAYKQSQDNYLRDLEGKINEKDKRISDLEKKMDNMKNEINWLRSVVTKDMNNHEQEENHKNQQDNTTEHSPLDPFHLGKDVNINKVLQSGNEDYESGNKDIPLLKQKPKFKFAFKIKKGNDKLAA
ncbi:uncharacterized protein HGUI_03597 [Hanseniaspora guilliermondii]|uniref:Uncharacterized protein n=1 Tax=Hanseniaspora guilliermondii TaxID=56406 RepID=A0A1L0B6D9_9ASCO|nr:uncharacterized protein HGUI_03597 [Hanseniaspora guilliermondii]